MHLKNLSLQGFKSFADPTVIEFHKGVTGIVGPNGCGKSNVVDAIRWVLGETSAKALRGGEMADVIFNGTDRRKPVNMAEVILTLTDCEQALGVDFNEMSIGRRVFRDGSSEYRLNGKKCRLKDIMDVLMDTGIGRTAYSIMEQGKIDMLLSSKPEDRRSVFEEAAGITKFKSQKKEALRKLEYTEANLLRIEDILAEVKRQMGSLQRQAQKARRYQALLDDVKVLDSHHSYRQFESFQAERAELENSLGSLQAEQADLETKIAEGDESMDSYRKGLADLEYEVERQREEVTTRESAIQAAESRLAFNEERKKELTEFIDTSSGDLDGLQTRLSEQQAELNQAEGALAAVVSSLMQQRDKFEQQSGETQRLREQRGALELRSHQINTQLKALEEEQISNAAKVESSESQLAGDRERLSFQTKEAESLAIEQVEKQEAALRLSEKVSEAERLLEAKREELTETEVAHQEAEASLQVIRQEVNQLSGEHTSKASRRDVLKQLIAEGEGLQGGTQEVLKGLDNPEFFKNGVRGVLGSFIQVDDACIGAVEAALGGLLQTVVVSDTNLAESIIETLTVNELGTVSLLSEDFITLRNEGQMMTVPDGAIAWALDKIKVHDSVRGLMESLLGDVLIVDDLSVAMRLKPQMGRTAFATPRGEFISSDGVISGGKSKEEGSLLRRENEVRELEVDTAALQRKLDRQSISLEEEEARMVDARGQVEILRRNIQQQQVDLSNLQGQSSGTESELHQVSSKLEALEWERAEIQKRLDQNSEGVDSIKQRQTELETQITGLRDERDQKSRELEDVSHRETESADQLSRIKTALAVEENARQSLEEQKNPISHRLDEFRGLIQRRSDDITLHKERIQQADEESTELTARVEGDRSETQRLRESLNGLDERKRERANELNERERVLSQQRSRLSEIGRMAGKEEVGTTKIALKMESLEETMRERYQIELRAFEPDTHALLLCINQQKMAHERLQKRRASIANRVIDDQDEESTSANEEAVAEAVANSSESEQVEDSEAVVSEHSEADVEAVAEAVANDGEQIEAQVEDATENAEGDTEDSNNEEIEGLEPLGQPDWEFVEMAAGELRQRLESIGTVNLDAITEFEELEDRFRHLDEQFTDLVNGKEELLRVIAKINTETRQLFTNTFEQVRANFQDAFKELFGSGARANLVLVDADNPLESGIEVIAKPPGKKLQSISLLSGGERSMTAVALLFSIYMVKPSPFCVLDELDAPLDESNISRFLKMLDRFIDQSQFIIVTHNKRTMRRADVMYGITMEEFGVSKPVGMKLRNGGRVDNPDSEIPTAPSGDDSDSQPITDSGIPALAAASTESGEDSDDENYPPAPEPSDDD